MLYFNRQAYYLNLFLPGDVSKQYISKKGRVITTRAVLLAIKAIEKAPQHKMVPGWHFSRTQN
jgi:hypothetical protein